MMRNPIRNGLAAGTVFLLFGAAAWPLPSLLGAAGARVWVLRGGLLLFGLIAALLLFLFLRSRSERALPAPDTAGADDIGLALAAAQARLGASPSATESRVARLPLILVLGPSGSTKTSVVAHSGLDAELLSGEVSRADVPVPTDPVNVWYARGTVIVEAGGRLLDDEARWQRLVRLIRPSRLAAAFGRGTQSPRAAVVCFPCDEFLKPGASAEVAAAARRLRTRLGEVSQELGIQLPVYVLFTRSDRLPYFAEYVRNLSTGEAQQVLGATLPVVVATEGSWAEAQARRLQPAFDRLVRSLSLSRLDVLSRETQEQVRAAAYEFPRELRKISELAVQFLVDVARPSQLGLNPFLRGFYFTGVRPVVLSDIAAEQAAAPAVSEPVAGATSVFNPRMLQQHSGPPMAVQAGGRKVPQWVFLRRLFHEVLLGDDVAARLTGGGTRVNLMRRGLIASVAVAGLIVALGATVSFAGNRRLVRASVAAAADAREIGGLAGVVGEEDLARLDALRERTAEVTRYERERRPLRLAWGLYSGGAVQPLLRSLYFRQLDRALWSDTQARLLEYLRGLPALPDENSDFGRAQDALAAHLLTTSEFHRATPDLLTPVLLTHTRPVGTDSAGALVQRQFTFFASELPHGNPYDVQPDAPLIERTQRFLRAFGAEAYYRALVYEGNRAAPPARYLGPQGLVRNEVAVPGAFTTAGWRHVQAQLDSVDHLFVRYQWIYGSEPPADKPRRDQLAELYASEYVQRWQDYLARGSVERFSSVSDAALKLGMLGAPSSPLFGMLALASRETALDSATAVARAFQPLHATVAPDADPRGSTASALGYANSLNGLSSSLNLLANAAGGARDQALLQASAAAAIVRTEAATLAAGFAMSGDAAVTANQLQRLLRQPADFTDALVSGLPSSELNAAGRAFCSTLQPVAQRFPFSSRASADASVDEVNAIFLREEGVLWSFYQDALSPLLTPQGRPRPGARVGAGFARFFGRAAEFSSAVYRGGQLGVLFDFQPEIPAGATEVLLQVDGDQGTFTPTSRASRTFAWEAARAREARLIVVFGGERIVVAGGQGPWAPFRMFATAEWGGSGPYRVEWQIPGRGAAVTAQVSFESGVPAVFRPSYVGALSQCVSQITN
jgi:type VI secretion system protein ImpL